MRRREFLINGMITSASALLIPGLSLNRLFASTFINQDLFNIPKPMDVKLNIKPLFGKRIPLENHEGPCRANDPTGWNRGVEQKKASVSYNKWKKHLVESLGNGVNILEPVYVEYTGDHRIDNVSWSQITSQNTETDLYLLSHYRIPGLSDKTDKPIVLVGNSCAALDVSSRVKSRGGEAYAVLDYDALEKLIPAFKVRKALRQTKILNVTNGKWDYQYNTVRSNIDVDLLRDKFGIDCVYISIYQMMEEYEKVKQDKKYLQEAEIITKKLTKNAEKNTMKEEDIQLSVLYYLTSKKLMEKHGCNSFTATCQEFCVTNLPKKYKVTPCLTHSFLKDEGYISTCEGDVNVLLSMALQMYLAQRAAYMGNTLIHNRDKNQVFIWHDVPSLKMKGFDQPDLPFRIVSFTERGWGATIRYDFSRDKGETVTFCRMTPNADKLLVVKGIMEGVGGLDDWGCELRAIIKISDVMEYFRKATQTGHHFSMIYGDYIDDMKNLCNIMNIDFECLT
jgi:L-fucose isomerase-like protein